MISIHREKGIVVSAQSGREGAKNLIEREKERSGEEKIEVTKN